MRKVVFQMMTTLNGRLDDPDAWVTTVDDEQFKEIDRQYERFDTLLVGKPTYIEMQAYWSTAGDAPDASAVIKSMARKMNAYKKYVISDAQTTDTLNWNNTQQVAAHSDGDIIRFINELKDQQGGDIHLAGGARLAQSIVRLGLVDEYHFFVYPVVSKGASWFDRIKEKREMKLLAVHSYGDIVGLYYAPKG